MLLLTQLLGYLQLPLCPLFQVGRAVHRRTWRVWLAAAGGTWLFTACAPTADEAAFRLDRASGAPIVNIGREQFQMDWQGKVVLGIRESALQGQRTKPLIANSLEVFSSEIGTQIQAQLAGEVQHVYVAPDAPDGWHTCAAITTQSSPATETGSTGKPAAPRWQAHLFDAQNGTKLAELELNTIFSQLYYDEPGKDFRAEVRSASIGPAGGIGLLLWFAQGGDYYLDGGIWNGEQWTPLMCIQPSGAAHEQIIYVGPGDHSVLQTPYSLFFSGSDGRLLNIWILKGSFLRLFQQAFAIGLAKALLLAAAGGISTVALLGFLWQVFNKRSRKRRLS